MKGRNQISDVSVVETKEIGDNVKICEFAVIRERVRIGNNVIIHPHVIINPGVLLGDGVEVFSGSVLGKEPKGAGAVARTPQFERSVVIGNNSLIGPHAVIFYDVQIGSNTLIGDGASIREQCRIGSRCIISRYVTINYNTTVGDRTKIMDLSHITGNSVVGSDVFVSCNVGMANDNLVSQGEYVERCMKGPTISDGAVIGASATLLPGVLIGRNAVVGAGAVVSSDVPAGKVVMGVPARVVRSVEREM
jgi:acetyltransferase-like isoleucine patch superfamily enzyme